MARGKVWATGALSMMMAVAAIGCSSGSTTTTSTPSVSPPASSSAASAAPAASPGASGKLVDKPVTFRVVLPENASQPLIVDAPAIQEIFRKTNIKVNLEPVPGSYDEKKKTLLATNNIPDIMYLGRSDLDQYARTGAFLPISDYLAYMPNFKKLMDATPEIKKLMIDGKLYGFPQMRKWGLRNGYEPMIRTDILQKLNVPVPTTYDELYEVLKKMKAAYPNSSPITFRLGVTYFMKYVAFNFGSGNKIYFEPEAGKYLYGPAHPEYKAPLEYLNKLYKEKLLDPDYAVNTAQTWQEKLSSGRSFFYLDNNQFAVNFNKALQVKEPEAKFEQIPLLKNAKGQKRGLEYDLHWWDMYAISSKVSDPIAAVKLLDWMYSDEGVYATSYGVLGEHYTMENGQPKVKQSVIDQFKDKQDPLRAMQSALGTGALGFALYVDEHPMVALSPGDLVTWSDLFAKDAGQFVNPLQPSFTKEETDKLKALQSKVDTIVDQELDKFIMGVRPLDDFAKFSQQLIDNGALDIETIYNTALARVGK
ncbi:extracellular solute-binding protein [Paenibacillus cymbidii]|uniref:extracellular solute-binding protein n=1 Tax=Paenibacillus cymbidii TaxID=1639034 RepID=UPI001436C837|nr:extracellular solute-binding protein [Paenibacillus cymbidii]